MKIYFGAIFSGREIPLAVVDGDYVPLVGDQVHLDLKKWIVVKREFDTDPSSAGHGRVLFARVLVRQAPNELLEAAERGAVA